MSALPLSYSPEKGTEDGACCKRCLSLARLDWYRSHARDIHALTLYRCQKRHLPLHSLAGIEHVAPVQAEPFGPVEIFR